MYDTDPKVRRHDSRAVDTTASFATTFASTSVESGRRLKIGMRPLIAISALVALVSIGFLIPSLVRSSSEAAPGPAAAPAATPTGPAATPTGPAATPTGPAATPTGAAATPTRSARPPARPIAPQALGSLVAVVAAESGMCVTVSQSADGIPLELRTCDDLALQKWEIRDDGTIRQAATLCADLPWAATTAGTQLQVANCNGGIAQQFDFDSSGQIISRMARKCVGMVGVEAREGARLELRPCGAGSNQKWNVQ